MRRVSSRHRRYLLLDQGVGAGIVNLLLNAAIAWLLFRGVASVPMWGQQSIGGDTIGTAFVLPFLSTLIASAVVRSQVRAGYVPAAALSARSVLRRLPQGLVRRGAVLRNGRTNAVPIVSPPMLCCPHIGTAVMPRKSSHAIAALSSRLTTPAPTPWSSRR